MKPRNFALENNLAAAITLLKNRDMTNDELDYYYPALQDDVTRSKIVVMAAAYQRDKLLTYFCAKSAVYGEQLERWIDYQLVSIADEKLPECKAALDKAIFEDNGEYLFRLSAYTDKIREYIVSQLLAADIKTLLKCENIKTKFSEVNSRFVEELPKQRQHIQSVLTAIQTNNDFIKCYDEHNHDAKFSDDIKGYFLVYAAQYQNHEAARHLVISLNNQTGWLANWVKGQYSMPEMLVQYDFESIDKVEDVLLNAVKNRNLAYLQFLEKLLVSNYKSALPADTRLKLALEAVEIDDVDILAYLVDTLKCHYEPSKYDWQNDHYKDEKHVTSTYSEYAERRTGYSTKRVYDEPELHLKYNSALLQAAEKEKLRTFEWLLKKSSAHKSRKNNESNYRRCQDMAKTRPALRAFLNNRTDNLADSMKDLTSIEIDYYVNNIWNITDQSIKKNVVLDFMLAAMQQGAKAAIIKLVNVNLYDSSHYSGRKTFHLRDLLKNTVSQYLKSELSTDENEKVNKLLLLYSNTRKASGEISDLESILLPAARMLDYVKDIEAGKPCADLQQKVDIGDSIRENRDIRTFLFSSALKVDNLNFYKQHLNASLETQKEDIFKAASADAVNIFKEILHNNPCLIANNQDWQKLCNLANDGNHPKIHAHLNTFPFNPQCNHKEHFRFFESSARYPMVNIRKDGKRYKAVLVEEVDSDSDEDSSVLKPPK